MPPFVYEDAGFLTLQFQSCVVQSEMKADDPGLLTLSYTRTMMGFLLLNSSPKNIAMIGLGGGSISKWCYKELPATDITVIEINPGVIALRDVFHIPQDGDRFHLVCGDGADYVAETSDEPEVLLVDGFDYDGQPPQLCSQTFYDNCYRALGPNGILVVNLCGLNDRVLLDRIQRSFPEQGIVVVLPEDGSNKIVFATKGDNRWLLDEPLLDVLTRFGNRTKTELREAASSHLAAEIRT